MLSLPEWLERLESQHPTEIDLGLERVSAVAGAMGLLDHHIHTFSVAGTNGKGSVVCVLDHALRHAGFNVGVYTSPHFHRFNERICLNGREAEDSELVTAFEAVERYRDSVSLTYFEFSTLAALWLFREWSVDHQVLEVGLGGRLDAVNIVDADVSVVTSIGLDHMDWLGSDRAEIAIEKAGIARSGRFCVVSEAEPPSTLVDALNTIGAKGLFINDDWCVHEGLLTTAGKRAVDLPKIKGLRASNIAAALQSLEVAGLLCADEQSLGQLETVYLPGRLDSRDVGGLNVVFDVAHNTESVLALAEFLEANPVPGTTRAIFGVMGDKPIHDMLRACEGLFKEWNVVELKDVPRAALPSRLIAMIGDEKVVSSGEFADVWASVAKRSRTGDRVVIFGSFLTVAEGYTVLANQASLGESA